MYSCAGILKYIWFVISVAENQCIVSKLPISLCAIHQLPDGSFPFISRSLIKMWLCTNVYESPMKSLPSRIISHWQQIFDICSVHYNVISHKVRLLAINHNVASLSNYIHQPNLPWRLRFKSSLLTWVSL